MTHAYSTITETPGIGASRQQLSILYTRYKFASSFCKGKDVLEVACGAGQGLGYIGKVAKKVVGGDIDEENLHYASNQYHGRPNIFVRKIDAHQIPFEDYSFDVILLYEAIYYLQDPKKFLSECRRLLRKDGVLLISSVNKAWSDFNPSPFSTYYFSARELSELLRQYQFDTQLFGAFPTQDNSVKGRVISKVKRTAVALHLIPKTMKGKQFLKRVFFGKLTPLPSEIHDGLASFVSPIRLPGDATDVPFKFFFAVGKVS